MRPAALSALPLPPPSSVHRPEYRSAQAREEVDAPTIAFRKIHFHCFPLGNKAIIIFFFSSNVSKWNFQIMQNSERQGVKATTTYPQEKNKRIKVSDCREKCSQSYSTRARDTVNGLPLKIESKTNVDPSRLVGDTRVLNKLKFP